jgi:hypothetical protein
MWDLRKITTVRDIAMKEKPRKPPWTSQLAKTEHFKIGIDTCPAGNSWQDEGFIRIL